MVTGTRLVTGFSTPTPVTTLNTEQILQSQPSTLSQALNQIPTFKNSVNPQSQGAGTTGANAASFLNLRGLGVQRTLVLLNGRRVVPSTSLGATDISILPSALVRRVDVVTGGASAAYGSDAVAGVVNFILDESFVGVRGELQGGISSRGDNQNYRVSLAAGARFLDDRVHLLASVEHYESDGIPDTYGRAWAQRSCAPIANPAVTTANPASPSNPSRLNACGVRAANSTYGGLISSGPLAGTQFVAGGASAPFVFGTLRSTDSMVGGDGVDGLWDNSLTGEQERTSLFGHLSFDVTDYLTLNVEALYAQAKASYDSTYPFETSNAFTIFRDNAFLPADVAARMDTAGIASFRMGRLDRDFGMTAVDAWNRTFRIAAGATVRLGGGWSLDAYYTHGRNRYRADTVNDQIYPNVFRAADAVRNGANQIVCRSTLTNPNDGCVPINLFGEGSPSQAALDYVLGTAQQWATTTQDVASLTVRGEPFALPAGPVAFAAGAEYRRESSFQIVDPLSTTILSCAGIQGCPTSINGQLGIFERTNPQPYDGRYNIREAFAEILAPILQDAPFARSLNLNGAARYTDYSTSGGVTTWKVGVDYQPIEDVRLRVTRSRDIRAPNISELFTPPTQAASSSTVTDPSRGGVSNPGVNVRNAGNPDLVPERADTLTAGVVFRPRFLSGLNLSVDYYRIRIAGAIGQLGAQSLVNQCFEGNTTLCALITRDANGIITTIDNQQLNIASLKTSGVDIEASYRLPLTQLAQGLDGTITFRGLATYLHELVSQNPGAAPIDRAGDVGAGTPHWQATLSMTYENGPLDIFLQERFIGAGKFDNTLTPRDIDRNVVDSVFYTDITARYRFGEAARHVELFVTVNNLFDADPPLVGSFSRFGTTEANRSIHDVVGRQFTGGVRFRF